MRACQICLSSRRRARRAGQVHGALPFSGSRNSLVLFVHHAIDRADRNWKQTLVDMGFCLGPWDHRVHREAAQQSEEPLIGEWSVTSPSPLQADEDKRSEDSWDPLTPTTPVPAPRGFVQLSLN